MGIVTGERRTSHAGKNCDFVDPGRRAAPSTIPPGRAGLPADMGYPGDKSNAVSDGTFQDILGRGLRAAKAVLHGGNGRELPRRLDVLHIDLGQAQCLDLALLPQFRQHAELFPGVDLGIDVAELEQVNGGGVELALAWPP